eukprot:TRINITY_DN38774_c0_g1_i1.p1 TRINITY_DN38774_c0_g1~~TRINITY_DN38774_c0_g1_i1.p1  ORF type:complete len:284 (+),score=31.82 TRINITY_DN38774_c0_g1_i1:1384-2235(+)
MAGWADSHPQWIDAQVNPGAVLSPPFPPPLLYPPPPSTPLASISPATTSFISVNPIMTVLGFIFSCAIILCVGGRLLCLRFLYRRRLMGQVGRLGQGGEQALTSMPGGASRGITETVIQTFPTFKYTNEGQDALEDTQCVVCIGDYERNDLLRRLPPCGHYFHVSCIDSWLSNHNTCPVCRTSLDPVDPTVPPDGATIVDLEVGSPLVAGGAGQVEGVLNAVGHRDLAGEGEGRGGGEEGEDGRQVPVGGINEVAMLIPSQQGTEGGGGRGGGGGHEHQHAHV